MASLPPPPEALLFDLDGTLLDSIELIVRSFQHATHTHQGVPLRREEIIPRIGLSLIDELERIAPGRGNDLLQTYRTFLVANHDDLIAEYPGVADMLEALNARGLPLGIVTSKSQISATPSFARFPGIPNAMRAIVTYEETERHKPHPEPLFLAAERLGVAPERCWYIGDSTHDMQAARAAGMYAVGALWGPYGREPLAPLADILIAYPSDLLPLLP